MTSSLLLHAYYKPRCEHWSPHNRKHLFEYPSRNKSIHMGYLTALFLNDKEEIERFEAAGELAGYGPQAQCFTIENFSVQKAFCREFPRANAVASIDAVGPARTHRQLDGPLEHLPLRHVPCKTTFMVYEPKAFERAAYPYVLVVCNGAHTHPVPLPTKTPQAIQTTMLEMLHGMEEALPDATPRRVMRDASVRAQLHKLLPHIRDPTLSDLHPSLSNKDHIRSYLRSVKEDVFPFGTGWEGE